MVRTSLVTKFRKISGNICDAMSHICSYAIVGTMAEVGVRRPTARALVLESSYHSQVRALI
jgi:hypothetical protein